MVNQHAPCDLGLGVHGAVVRYDDGPAAVDGVNLQVPRGEVLGLLGPSGCGKSSLLRAIAGLVPLTAGKVTWDGSDLAPVPVHRRGFGLMFQDGQLFPHRNVAGNIGYGLETLRLPRSQRQARVAELLELVGLSGFGDREVTTLSGGQRQRIALARALAPRPRLLLLDEPLSSLDRGLREHLAGELRDILRAAGLTVIYVTHDHDEAMTVADRIAIMIRGQLHQVATPEVLWHQPVNVEVARFLGYRPLLPAEATDGGLRTILGTVPFSELPGEIEMGRAAHWQVAVGPLALAAQQGDDAEVISTRYHRGRVMLDVRLPDGQRATAWATRPPQSTRVGLRIDPSHIAVLRPESTGEIRS